MLKKLLPALHIGLGICVAQLAPTNCSAQPMYDNGSYQELVSLQARNQPDWNTGEIDPKRSRRVANQALAIHARESISEILKRSDLSDWYYSLRKQYKRLAEQFKYAVVSDGESLHMRGSKPGKNFVELDLNLDLKHGFNPQLRFGEVVRLRYDYVDKRSMLEYAITW